MVWATNLSTVQAEFPPIGELALETQTNLQRGGPQVVASLSENPLTSSQEAANWQALDTAFLQFGAVSTTTAWTTYSSLPASSQAAFILVHDSDFWEQLSPSWLDIILQTVGIREIEPLSPILVYLIDNDPALLPAKDQLDQLLGVEFAAALQNPILSKILMDTYRRDDLANWYLSRAYFGHLRFGVEEAAQFYFDRSARELDLPQAAMLASFPFNPDENLIEAP
ncbi:MAG: transglycosylase domain-containing protein, partial [Chloroflexota bacterium]